MIKVWDFNILNFSSHFPFSGPSDCISYNIKLFVFNDFLLTYSKE